MGQLLCVIGDAYKKLLNTNDYKWNHYLCIDNQNIFDTPETICAENIYCYAMKVKNTSGKNIIKHNDYIFIWDGDIYDREKIYDILSFNIEKSKLCEMYDIELLKELYIINGVKCFDNIIGDYAICIINIATKNVYCYRSPFGLRSLYYYYDKETFMCCTSLELIIKLINPGVNITSEHFSNYILEYMYCPFGGHKKYTPYSNTYVLRHCYNAIYNNGEIISELQWIPKIRNIYYKNEIEYAEEFGSLFETAILNLLNSQPDRKWVLSLSGGLDSSSIACIIYKLYNEGKINKKIDLFHNHHNYNGDELEYAKTISEYTESDLNIIPPFDMYYDFNINDTSNSHILPHTDIYMKIPITNPTIYAPENIFMSGIGGDQILTGNIGYIAKYFNIFNLNTMFKNIKRVSNNTSSSMVSIFQSCVLNAKKNYNKVYNTSDLLNDIYSDDYKKRQNEYLHSKPLSFKKIYDDPSSQNDYIELMTRDQWAIDNSAFDNSRSPYLNSELVQYCLSLPGNIRNDGVKGKLILRNYMKDKMPELITNRMTKSGTEDTLRISVKNNWEDVMNIYNNSVLEKSDIFKRGSIQRIFYGIREGTIFDIVPMMRMIELEMWLQLKERMVSI